MYQFKVLSGRSAGFDHRGRWIACGLKGSRSRHTRAVSLFAVATLAIALVGCGSSTGSTSQPSTLQSQQQTSSQAGPSSTPEESSTQAVAASSAEASSTAGGAAETILPAYTDLQKQLEASPAKSGKRVSIALVTGLAGDPYFQAMKCGAETAAKDFDVKFSWNGTQDTSTAAVLQVLDAVMVKSPDGLIFEPFDSTGEVAPIKQIVDKGTPVEIVDGSLSQKVGLQNPRTDNYAAGEAAGKKMGSAVDGAATVGIIADTPANAVQGLRVKGFEDGLKSVNPKVKLLPIGYAQQDKNKAAQITSGWLTAHPDLKAVYAANGPMGSGVVSAVKAAQKKSQVLIYSFDTEPDQMTALRNGDLDLLVGQSPSTMGYYAVAQLTGVLRGAISASSLPYDVFAPFDLITKDNMKSAAAKPFIYGTTCS